MTGPQPGTGSPIIQMPTLRPTDVVREPGLDQSQEIPPLARLLMAKGQLALEQEKFQAGQQQAKQKKQMLDQMGQGLAQLFQNPDALSTEKMPGTLGQAAGIFGQAGEVGAAGRAIGDLPNAVKQRDEALRQQTIQKTLPGLLNTFRQGDVTNPLHQADFLYNTMVQAGPEAAKTMSDAIKPLQGNVKFAIVPGVGLTAVQSKFNPDGSPQDPVAKILVREPPKPGQATQQKRNDIAGVALQHVANLQQLMGGPTYNPKFTGNIEPTTAAGMENVGAFAPAKALMGGLGALGVGPGTPEAGAQQLRPDDRQAYRLQVQGLVYNYATWMGGSPRSMPLLNLILKTVDPQAGSSDQARRSAWTTIQQMKQAMIDSRAGKPVQWEGLPFFGEIQADVAHEGTQGQQQPLAQPQQTPLTLDDL